MAVIVEIERFCLSDGGLARITKLGRLYNFTRTYATLEEPPDGAMGLTKEAAYKLLADVLAADCGEEIGSS